MTRVPLRDIDGADPATAEVFRSFERENRVPIDLFRALANAPGLLGGFNAMSDALRYSGRVPRKLRELAILWTARLAGSEYEWAHHVGMALAAGVTRAQVEAVAAAAVAGSDSCSGSGSGSGSRLGPGRSGAFGATERAVLALAGEMHAGRVSETTFAAAAAATSAEEATELVVLCAHYQGVARIIQALGVRTEPDYVPAVAWPGPDSPR